MLASSQSSSIPPMEASRKLHAHLTVTGSSGHSPLLFKVLLSYALSPPHLPLALRLFDRIQAPNTFLWNTMIRGFAQSDAPGAAVAFYGRMRRQGVPIDHMTFPFALKACARVPSTREGSRMHADCLKFGFSSDIFVSNSLIHLYSACGDLLLANKVFDEMPERNLVSWNSLICACSQHGRPRAALRLFESMRMQDIEADKVTMVKVVSACTHLGAWDLAESMVKYIRDNNIEVDVYLGNTLIDYYGRRGSVEHAQKVFEEMSSHNIVTLNAVITTYAKAGDLVSARRIFDTMPERDLISWSSMITGYSQANHFLKALSLFREMQKANIQPDEVVIASVLSSCAHLGALDLGRSLHDYMRKNNTRVDIYAANSLIDMYSKCGSIMEALEVFRGMDKRDTMSWNIIMLGLATNGYADRVLRVFSDMLSQGFRPNDGSFLGILVACAHGGLVEEGLEYFDSMKKDFGLEPQMKHYGCVVDLLSRSGELNKAYNFIKEMPFTPDPIVWRTLLAACCTHGNVDLAEIATEKLNESDPNNSGNYVLLSNTYAMANRWSDATSVRGKMECSDVQKVPGCSSIEVVNLAHKPTASELPQETEQNVLTTTTTRSGILNNQESSGTSKF